MTHRIVQSLGDVALDRGVAGAFMAAVERAERRASARRLAALDQTEVSALLISARSTLRRARGLSDGSWLALAGLAVELEHEAELRLGSVRA